MILCSVLLFSLVPFLSFSSLFLVAWIYSELLLADQQTPPSAYQDSTPQHINPYSFKLYSSPVCLLLCSVRSSAKFQDNDVWKIFYLFKSFSSVRGLSTDFFLGLFDLTFQQPVMYDVLVVYFTLH